MSSGDDDQAFRRLELGAEFIRAIEALAGYRLPKSLESLFGKAHHRAWLSWKNDTITPSLKVREWHLRVSRHLEEARHTTCATLYHRDNVVRIESALDLLVAEFREALEAQDGTGRFYSGLTSKLSFEYHAFVSAAVRTMNHVSMATGWLFGKRCPNLVSLEKVLAASAPEHPAADQLKQVLVAHRAELGKLFSRSHIRSIRDRIMHEEFLFAGSLWIVQGKAMQSGILKPDFETMPPGQEGVYRLSEVMRGQVVVIERFLVDVVTLIDRMLPRIDGR